MDTVPRGWTPVGYGCAVSNHASCARAGVLLLPHGTHPHPSHASACLAGTWSATTCLMCAVRHRRQRGGGASTAGDGECSRLRFPLLLQLQWTPSTHVNRWSTLCVLYTQLQAPDSGQPLVCFRPTLYTPNDEIANIRCIANGVARSPMACRAVPSPKLVSTLPRVAGVDFRRH